MEREEASKLNVLTQQYKALAAEDHDAKDSDKQKTNTMDEEHKQLTEELITLYERKMTYEQKQYEDLQYLKRRTMKEYDDEILALQK